MIVDTSALVAIIVGEPERAIFLEAILNDPSTKASAGTLLELGIVIDRLADPLATRRVDDLMSTLGIEVVPVTAQQVSLGRAAYRDFGRGSGHRARLNFGDCFAYALARETGEPLLFKGDDFTQTGITAAVSS
jgi:ribonuclease VapC